MKKNIRNIVVTGLIAVLFMTALPTKPVHADTNSLISQIIVLLEEIKSLQAELRRLLGMSSNSNSNSSSNKSSTSGAFSTPRSSSSSGNNSSPGGSFNACSTNLTSNQTVGSEGSQVTALQQFLIGQGYSIPGGATGYFGQQTKSAVASFQQDQNITLPEGYFGPTTRARVQSLCGNTSSGNTSSGSSNSIQSAMLSIHNEARRKVGVPPLTWSDTLTRSAQAYANDLKSRNCPLVHSDSDYGENLYREWTSREIVLHPANAAQWWVDEDKFYNYNNNSCTPGEMCGHYTQIVWESTERVGCAVTTCSVPGKNTQMWVCHYDPPGNFYGKRPY